MREKRVARCKRGKVYEERFYIRAAIHLANKVYTKILVYASV